MSSRSDIESCLREVLKAPPDPTAIEVLARIHDEVARGHTVDELLASEHDLEGMRLLEPTPAASDQSARADDDVDRTIGDAVSTYIALGDEGRCLVPMSVIPFARNEHHHFLLIGVDDDHSAQIYYHDTEGQGGVLHDDWNDLLIVRPVNRG